jgi:SMC interacting uncharacterized protein involved in chromosome segregation
MFTSIPSHGLIRDASEKLDRFERSIKKGITAPMEPSDLPELQERYKALLNEHRELKARRNELQAKEADYHRQVKTMAELTGKARDQLALLQKSVKSTYTRMLVNQQTIDQIIADIDAQRAILEQTFDLGKPTE